MTALQAIQQARETGQIALSKPTANILQALAEFDKASENMALALTENLPCEMSDLQTADKLTDDFLNLMQPVEQWLYEQIGFIMFKGLFVFQIRNEFQGL